MNEIAMNAIPYNAIGWSILGSILGAIIAVLVSHWLKERSDRRKASAGLLTGNNWVQNISAQDGRDAKQDSVECRQIGPEITGKINRQLPDKESSKSWHIRGIKRGSVVFLIFWSVDPQANTNSYGTIQLEIIDENNLRGFYVKRHAAEKKTSVRKWKQFNLEWKRLPENA